jgi:hypothetical protein
MLEQPARLIAQAAIASTRFITTTVRSCGQKTAFRPQQRWDALDVGRLIAAIPHAAAADIAPGNTAPSLNVRQLQ